MNDSLSNLTEREIKRLSGSWAKEFGDIIFPMIDESGFAVIYSDNPASRPNNPVNVYFGLLLLKEVFSQSDEEVIDSLLFDIRYQYALHTTSFEEQPVSKNSLSNFRRAIYEYNEVSGRDLIKEEIESQAEMISKFLKIDEKMKRMDSMMISSSCKRLTRLEIVYNCVQRLVREADKYDDAKLTDKFRAYLNRKHKNDVIYRSRSVELSGKLIKIMNDAEELEKLFAGTEIAETQSYKLLTRMIAEQTKEHEGKRELLQAKEISPDSLQNPTDPDACYRTKAGKEYVGYVGNVIEGFNGHDSVITGYDIKPATYSDQSFTRDVLSESEYSERCQQLLTDGAFYSDALAKEAETQNIELIPTGIVGRTARGDYSEFKIDEKNHEVLFCKMGHAPLSCKYKNEVYKAYFEKGHCENCPNLEACPVTRQTRRYMLKVAQTQINTSKLKKRMGTVEYQQLAAKRAGIEGIPSVLRRKYSIDYLPVRGLVRSSVWFGLKIGAINAIRMLGRVKRHRRQRLKTRLSQCLLSHGEFLQNTSNYVALKSLLFG
jgi:hypothetical protein